MNQAASASSLQRGTAALWASGAVSAGTGGWQVGEHRVALDGPVVMGILNLTPDSFSDGGVHQGIEEALLAAEAMIADGARILDIGGESTRPGAELVPADEEIRRVVPFLREARVAFDVPLSVDTRKAEVAEATLDEGASCINDVSGLSHDPEMAATVARFGAGLVLMHMRGEPATMRSMTSYADVTTDVRDELSRALDRALSAGVDPARIVLDPGLGFAKTAEQSLTLLRDLPVLAELGYPILVGPSRKSFLGTVLGLPPNERLEGTLAACVAAYLRGASIVRVHDVAPAVRALAVAHRVLHPEQEEAAHEELHPEQEDVEHTEVRPEQRA